MFPFRSIGMIVAWCAGSFVCAQQATDSGHLSLLRQQLEKQRIVLSDTLQPLKGCPQKKMYVVLDEQKGVKKAGLKIFPEEMNRDFHPAVYDFIERIFLHLALLAEPSKKEDLLRQDRLTLSVNGVDYGKAKVDFCSVLEAVDLKYPFSLSADSSRFRASWQGVGMKIDLVFPKQYDLLLGKDKYELTQAWIAGLDELQQEAPVRKMPKFNEKSLQRVRSNVYYDKEGTFLIPQMKSGAYLTRRREGWQYLLDDRFPEESVQNLFSHAPHMNASWTFSLAVKGYRSYSRKDVSLAALVTQMTGEGCRPYVGIETIDKEQVTGTVIYLNRDLMYQHLLYFQLPLKTLEKGGKGMKAVLYPYIPLNNLSNLYADESPSAVIQSVSFSH